MVLGLPQLLPRRVQRVLQRFRGGLVFEAHRRLYHSTLGLRVIQKKKKRACQSSWRVACRVSCFRA